MNPEALRYESDHVRLEHDRLRGLLEVEEMAIRLMARDLLHEGVLELPLGGELELIDHYIAEGAKAVFKAKFDAETALAVDGRAAA